MSFATINGVTLHFRLTGPVDGVPLILANSLGTDARIWDDVLPALAPQHRILTYDKRGHGLSDAPAGPYELDEHVSDLLGLAAHARFDVFALCGVSVGGMIAMRAAALHPDRIRALILCDTAATIGSAQSWNERIALVRTQGMGAISEAVLGRWLSPGFRERRPAEFAGWRNMLERCPAAGYAATCATVRDADVGPDLGRIRARTLVVAGENDLATPPDLVRELADTIPDARFELMREVGHVPSLERPAALAQLIHDHLNEVAHA